VIAYEANLSDNLSRLAAAIRQGEAPLGTGAPSPSTIPRSA
jgi:hypothetical protein